MSGSDDDDFEGGYGRPPVAHQFKKGSEPWNKGKKKAKTPAVINPRDYLRRPMKFSADDKAYDPLEVELINLFKLAHCGNMVAARRLLKHFVKARVIDVPKEEEREFPHCVYVPWNWSVNEFSRKYLEEGPPPWPGERDGVVPQEELDWHEHRIWRGRPESYRWKR